MPTETTAKSHARRRPCRVIARSIRCPPSKRTTWSLLNSSTPASRWMPAMTCPTSGPSTDSSGDVPGRTAVTWTPIWISEAATSEPMNPMPTTTARAPRVASCLMASDSATVRSWWTPGRSAPGTSRVLFTPPVVISSRSKGTGPPSFKCTWCVSASTRAAVACTRTTRLSSYHCSGTTIHPARVSSPRRYDLESGGRPKGGVGSCPIRTMRPS